MELHIYEVEYIICQSQQELKMYFYIFHDSLQFIIHMHLLLQ